jgi:hypothetical protein
LQKIKNEYSAKKSRIAVGLLLKKNLQTNNTSNGWILTLKRFALLLLLLAFVVGTCFAKAELREHTKSSFLILVLD